MIDLDLDGRTVRVNPDAFSDLIEKSGLAPDAFEALVVAGAMSESNASDRETGAVWRYALNSPPIYRSPNPARRSAYVLPTYDGDRPALGPRPRPHGLFAHHNDELDLELALVRREELKAMQYGDPRFFPGASVVIRRSHRAVHEALAGEPTPWCEWCGEGGR